jgi:uncharacterized membrane protein
MSYKVSAKRHLAKTISYRILSTGVGFLIMWWATGSVKVGAAFGAAELLLKPIIYFLHERAWYKWFKFGLIDTTEKKKKTTVLTEGKIKSQPKVYEAELTETLPPPPSVPSAPTGKKVLSYSSNR